MTFNLASVYIVIQTSLSTITLCLTVTYVPCVVGIRNFDHHGTITSRRSKYSSNRTSIYCVAIPRYNMIID